MEFCCHVIYSLKLDRYYVGHTEDINKRLGKDNPNLSSATRPAVYLFLLFILFKKM